MDSQVTDQAMAWLRQAVKKNKDELPDWSAYKDMVKHHLNDEFNMPFKLPKEYHYAYLRLKGLSHADALESMGLGPNPADAPAVQSKKSFWKFWE